MNTYVLSCILVTTPSVEPKKPSVNPRKHPFLTTLYFLSEYLQKLQQKNRLTHHPVILKKEVHSEC